MGKFLFLFCVGNIFIYSYGLLFFKDLFYNFLVVGIVVILIVTISSIVVIIENIFSELFIILVEKFFLDLFGFELKFFLEFFVENSLVVL